MHREVFRYSFMKNWNKEAYKNNNILLMIYHIIFTVISILMGLLVLAFNAKNYGFIILSWSAVHTALAYGSYNRYELSIKMSEYIFGLWALAFTVGIILSMYMILPKSL